MSQSLTFNIIDKVKHYIIIETHKTGVKYFICVRLMSYNHRTTISQ